MISVFHANMRNFQINFKQNNRLNKDYQCKPITQMTHVFNRSLFNYAEFCFIGFGTLHIL